MSDEAMRHEVEVEQEKRRWIKYYCEECKAWETREMFEVGAAPAPSPSPSPALWSWACTKLVRHASFQTFKVEELNSADGHDASPKLDFPATESPARTEPVQVDEQARDPAEATEEVSALQTVQARDPAEEAPEEVSALQTVQAASQSNGSSQSKRLKRNVRSAYARDSVTEAASPVNSQGGVTSSSLPADEAENGASTAVAVKKPKKSAKEGASAPESPAVIDADHHENGVHKRPRRQTAGDRYLAQALQYEKPSRAASKQTLQAEVNDVKPSQSSLEMKRPKRVTAGLRGAVLSAENAKSSPSPRVLAKKEQQKETVHEVRTRSETAKKPSKKNRKLGDLY